MVQHTLSARLTFPKPGGTTVTGIIFTSKGRIWYAGAGILLALGTVTMAFRWYRRRRAARNRT